MNMKIYKDTKYCLLVYIVQPIIDLCAKFQDDSLHGELFFEASTMESIRVLPNLS